MPRTKKKAQGIPTIDVSLIVIRVGDDSTGTEWAIDTANKLGVEPQVSTVEAIQLVKLGRVIAQKPQTTTITGHQLTLTDNVFTPEIMKILQGGEVTGSGATLKYVPPVSGSGEKGEIFELDAYSAEYDASGQIVKYEKITYPNCQGSPVPINTEDDVFRLPEYTIMSAPNKGQAPYELSYVTELPDFSEATLSVQSMSVASRETGLQKV